ncbi:ATP-dependent RNA helicase dbp8, partial [Colletotrichum higginsianum]
MPSSAAPRRPGPAADDEDPASSSSANSSGAESESDYLDSPASRKRRRTEPPAEPDLKDGDDDDDEELKAIVSTIKAPSRIKRAAAAVEEARQTVRPAPSQSTISAPTDPNTTFSAINVRPWLVQSLANMAIKRPTGIQKGCIPEILKGRDCIGGSRTGSGKTVAFAVPILQKWAEDPTAIFALVLTPTRELALQIFEQFKAISSPQSLKAIL